VRIRIKGGKLSKSREKRDEFLTPPCSCVSRGEPQAKLLGTFESILSGLTATLFGSLSQQNRLTAMALWNDKERSGQSHLIDSMNVKKVVINYFKPTSQEQHRKNEKADKNFY